MKKTKIVLGMLLIVVLSMTMIACGQKEEPKETAQQETPQQETPQATATPEETVKESTIAGTIVDASMNTLTLKNQAGNEFTFSTESAEMDVVNGLENGNMVEVTYSGDLGDGSTTVVATKVVDNNENTKAEVEKIEIEAESATMYTTCGVHIRASYSVDSDIVDSVEEGTEVAVTGKSANGWYRIAYNGSDAYISASYLTDTKPAPKATPQPAPQKPDPSDEVSEAYGKITYCDGATMKLEMDEKEYEFPIALVKVKLKDGLWEGEDVKIIYSGNLDDNPVLQEITDADM